MESKVDFLTLLKRRKDNLKDWLVRSNISTYKDFCKFLEGMNAMVVSEAVYLENLPKKVEVETVEVEEPSDKPEESKDSLLPTDSKKRMGRRNKTSDLE